MQDELLKVLDTKATEMAALVGKNDADSLTSLSAKRRVFKIELQSSNLWNVPIAPEVWSRITDLGLKDLYAYLSSVDKLLHYSRSSERKKWNPEIPETKAEIDSLPLSFDWFVNSSFDPDWEPLDFVSRCERIYLDQNLSAPGMVFTRIFDRQVKMIADFEDGLSLKLSSVTLT